MSNLGFGTEWGVSSPWGFSIATDYIEAAAVVRNMRAAGHDASVVWRGTTPWHYEFNDERAMQPVENETEVSAP